MKIGDVVVPSEDAISLYISHSHWIGVIYVTPRADKNAAAVRWSHRKNVEYYHFDYIRRI